MSAAAQVSPAKRRRIGAGVPVAGSSAVGLEVCVDCVSSARTAQAGGASSVELCAALVDGGTTPSVGMVKQVVQAVGDTVAVQVIIRPRGGDFLYSAEEVAVMLDDIAAAKAAGASGAVIGALTKDGGVDLSLTQRLGAAARPELALTFHRAIDLTTDPLAAVRSLVDLRDATGQPLIARILTSGGAATAPEGLGIIQSMVAVCKEADSACTVVPGGGLNAANVASVVAATGPGRATSRQASIVLRCWTLGERSHGGGLCSTGVRMVHASLRATKNGGMIYRKPGVFMGGEKVNTETIEFESREADLPTVQAVVATLRAGGLQ